MRPLSLPSMLATQTTQGWKATFTARCQQLTKVTRLLTLHVQRPARTQGCAASWFLRAGACGGTHVMSMNTRGSSAAEDMQRTGTRPARGAATETKRDVARMAENMAMVADQRKQVGGWQGHVWLAKSRRAVRRRVDKTKQMFFVVLLHHASGSIWVKPSGAVAVH